PRRQQTMRATLDWSFGLLTALERLIFQRSAAFVGGWGLEAAEAVCSGGGVGPQDVLHLLTGLVDASLVHVDDVKGRARYRLLEPVRQYAAENLRGAGESDSVFGRHRDWFLAKAESSPFELFDPEHVGWLAAELDNLRQAIRWSIQQGEIEAGLRLATRTS